MRFFKFVIVITFFLGSFVFAKEKELLAAALSVKGECFYERDGKTAPVKVKTIFFRNDRVFTKKGNLDVQIGPVAVLHLSPYSTVVLSELSTQNNNDKITVDLSSGRGYTKFAKKMNAGSSYTINSPTLVAGIRGTEFIMSAGGDEGDDADVPSGVFVNTGVVSVTSTSNAGAATEVNPGEQLTGGDNALVKSVMQDFIRKKMELFKKLEAMKEAQYKILAREKERQIEALERVRKSSKVEELLEKNKQLLNR